MVELELDRLEPLTLRQLVLFSFLPQNHRRNPRISKKPYEEPISQPT